MTTFAEARSDTRGGQLLAAEAAADLVSQAATYGLDVVAVACWPAGDADDEPPALPAFIVSTFSPMIAEVATRCLTIARSEHAHATSGTDRSESATAVVVMSPLGDITSAEYVAHAVTDSTRIGPLMFFQAVPNAVAGLIAARWGLTGPMVSLGASDGGIGVAAALIDDGDATGALVILAESHPDRAVALLVTPRGMTDEGEC